MRAEADLGLPVHFPGTNLDLKHSPLRPHDCSVNGPVAVFLGVGHVVVELAPDVRPRGMDDAQRPVATLHIVDDHTNRFGVVYLGKVDALATHLAPDAVDVLRAADHLRLNAGIGQAALEFLHDLAHPPLAFLATGSERRGDTLVLAGMQLSKCQVFKRPLELPDAKPAGERSEDPEGFARKATNRLRILRLRHAQCDHAFRELDDRDARIVDQRHQQIPHVVYLVARLVAEHRQVGQLVFAGRCHPQHGVHQVGDSAAERFLKRLFRQRMRARHLVYEARGHRI